MRRSAAYGLAQLALILAEDLPAADRLEALKVLFRDEEIALYSERRDGESGAEYEHGSIGAEADVKGGV